METEQTIQRQRQRQREGDSDEVGSGHTPLDVLDGQVTWLVKHKTTRVPADLSNILFLNKKSWQRCSRAEVRGRQEETEM